jgi:hypothetical protein
LMGVLIGAGSEPGKWRLWFAVLAPAAAWFIHLVATYMLVPWMCVMGGRALMIGFSVLLAAVAAGAGLVSWSMWLRLEPGERSDVIQTMEGSRVGFMVFAGLLASGLFLLAIILGTIPLFFIDPCSPMPAH